MTVIGAGAGESVIKDAVDNIEIDGSQLRLTTTRSVRFEPEGLFNLNVKLATTYFIKESVLQNTSEVFDGESVISEVLKQKSIYASPGLDRVSFIIASLTTSFGNSPLVTQPFFIDESSVEGANDTK